MTFTGRNFCTCRAKRVRDLKQVVIWEWITEVTSNLKQRIHDVLIIVP